MEKEIRRLALKQMAILTLCSGVVLEGCKKETENKAVVIPHKPLQPVYIPMGTFTKAPNGTASGDGVTTGAKIRSEHTNSQFCCQEIYLKLKQAGPPPHLHKELDEIMRVVEGTVHVLVGDTVTEVHAGDWHMRPHGIVHTFWNAGDVPARLLDMYPNQDFLSFFENIVRTENVLKSKGLTMQSPEATNLMDAFKERFDIEMFFDKFPAIIEKYGLTV